MGLDSADRVISALIDRDHFTVLRRSQPWTKTEVTRLARNLSTELYQNFLHPGVLIVKGEFPLDEIIKILDSKIEEHIIVRGVLNPKLPFRPICTK